MSRISKFKRETRLQDSLAADLAVAEGESLDQLLNAEPSDRSQLLIKHLSKRLDIIAGNILPLVQNRQDVDHYLSKLRDGVQRLIRGMKEVGEGWPDATGWESVLKALNVALIARIVYWRGQALRQITKNAGAFGRNLERLRIDKGWTFDQLSEASHVDKKLILGYVNDANGAHVGTRKKLAAALGTTVKELDRPHSLPDPA